MNLHELRIVMNMFTLPPGGEDERTQHSIAEAGQGDHGHGERERSSMSCRWPALDAALAGNLRQAELSSGLFQVEAIPTTGLDSTEAAELTTAERCSFSGNSQPAIAPWHHSDHFRLWPVPSEPASPPKSWACILRCWACCRLQNTSQSPAEGERK